MIFLPVTIVFQKQVAGLFTLPLQEHFFLTFLLKFQLMYNVLVLAGVQLSESTLLSFYSSVFNCF